MVINRWAATLTVAGRPGVTNTIIREKAKASPGKRALSPSPPARPPPPQRSNTSFGVEVQDLTPDLKRELPLKSDTGVVVTDVVPNSPAAVADIQPGDVITEVGRTAVLNLDAVQ